MENKIWIVLETEDVEVTGLHLFGEKDAARAFFGGRCMAEKVFAEEPSGFEELEGIVRIAGDASYAVQLIERDSPLLPSEGEVSKLALACRAISLCAKTFGQYAELHRSKATPEGDEKAGFNQQMADELSAICKALTP